MIFVLKKKKVRLTNTLRIFVNKLFQKYFDITFIKNWKNYITKLVFCFFS